WESDLSFPVVTSAMKIRITPNITFTGIAVVLLCAVAIPAHAATITVTNTNDSGAGSLRNALAIANDGDTITFAVTGTITLTSGELLVNKSVIISGPGADTLAVDGNANSRVFYIASGRTVTISGLTITNGNTPSGSGGDIGQVQIINSTLSGNVVESVGGGGGSIFNIGKHATVSIDLRYDTLSGNSASSGGSLFNSSFGGRASVDIRDTIFNAASGGN